MSPATTTTPKPTPPRNLSPDEITAALANLTPEKLALIRTKAAASGLSLASAQSCRKLTDGRIEITVTLPAEIVEPLEVWAEAAAEPLHPFIEKIIVDATTSYVFGGVLVPDAPAAVPAAAQPPAAPAAPPPAAR